jgi:imidazolonepropionase-like amidohydrolase
MHTTAFAGAARSRRSCCGPRVLVLAAALACAGGAPAADDVTAAAPALWIRAASLHVGDGTVIENGEILVVGGRIAATGTALAPPVGALRIDLPEGSLTPGLIDANARIEARDVLDPKTSVSAADSVFAAFGIDREGAARDGTAPARPAGNTDDDRAGHVEEEGEEHEDLHGGLDAEPALAVGVVEGIAPEQSSECVPHTRLLDGIDLGSPDFARLVRGGVTTVFVSTDGSAVIGPRGAMLRTAGALAERVVVPAGAVKAAMGTEPFRARSRNRLPSRFSGTSVYTRRPTTRMGVTWVFRKAFYDTLARLDGQPVRGADVPSPAASAVLARVLAGEVGLRVQARTLADITTAARLCGEFGVPFVLEEGTEAYRCLDLLAERRIPVVFGPIDGRAPRGAESRFSTFRLLLERGIETALSAQESREENDLARQAMYAQRFGVSLDAALRAVTSTPARLLGLDSEIGTLEPGKRADFVLWSGPPFSAVSRPLVVAVGGEIVVDRRAVAPQDPPHGEDVAAESIRTGAES